MFVWITKTLLWDQTPNTHNTANENKLMALREENLWWFNTWAVKSSGKLQPVRRCWVLVCVRCYFILPAGGLGALQSGAESCGWLQKRWVASELQGRSCSRMINMINSNMKTSARCCDSNPPITDSLSCWLQLFHCARLVFSPFYNPVFDPFCNSFSFLASSLFLQTTRVGSRLLEVAIMKSPTSLWNVLKPGLYHFCSTFISWNQHLSTV